MPAASTGCGRCGSGWTVRRWAATKATCHGSIGTTIPRGRGRTVVILAHIAGMPVEEWLMPFVISAGAALVGMRAMTMLDKNTREESAMNTPPIVSPQEWEAARLQLLVKEKELTRARDALAAERRRMPWLAVEKGYEFDGPEGKASLLDLFDGRRQLIVYRAFFEPGVSGWPEHACIGCSMVADQVAHLAHLNVRDTTLAFVSRAPQTDIERVKARMGWEMPWYTLTDGFDTDFGVDEWHGTNAFIRDGDSVFRTYFINSRGDEAMGSTWSYLDVTALGRQEEWEDSPEGYPQTPPYQWWIWHDEPHRTDPDRTRPGGSPRARLTAGP